MFTPRQLSVTTSISVRALWLSILPTFLLLSPSFAQEKVFNERSAMIEHRYLYWDSGLEIELAGYGAIEGVTIEFTVGPVETVDGVATMKVISDRSNDVPQHLWLAQDTLGNIWQLRSFDELSSEYHEEDVLYMPANPKVGEVYDLWDITYSSQYTVIAVDATVITPLQTLENCLHLRTVEDGIVEDDYVAPFLGLVRTEAASDPSGGFQLTGTSNFTAPTTPAISVQPYSQEVVQGAAAEIGVHVLSGAPATYQWYRGESGDTSDPVTGATHGVLQTSIVTADLFYWVEIEVEGETLQSNAALLTAVPDNAGPKLIGFGRTHWGQLGYFSATDPDRPVDMASGVSRVSAGTLYTLWITLDGTLWGTGQNTDGQLGNGRVENVRVPPISIDSGVAEVSAGASHALYIKTDGTLWGMGSNDHGQLGDGTTDRRTQPIQIATNVVAASASSHASNSFSLYLTEAGELMGMGNNASGQLGDGTNTGRLSPVPIDTEVASMAAGNFHSLYIKNDGRMFAMGWNGKGQLGDTTFENRMTPVQIDTDVKFVYGGNNNSFYVQTDGTMKAMGANIPGSGPETNDPVVYDTGVESVQSGAIQNGLYLKTGGDLHNLQFKNRWYQNVLSYAVGPEHSLYIQENAQPLSSIRMAGIQLGVDRQSLLIAAVPGDIQVNYQLYSGDDLENWSVHPTQNKTLNGGQLHFEVDYSTIIHPRFFQVFGVDP